MLPPALWGGRAVESIFGAGVEMRGPMSLPHRRLEDVPIGSVSGSACLEEEHRLSAQLAFTEPQSFLVEGEVRRNKRSSQKLKRSARVPAGVDYLSESWAKSTTHTEDSHWSANGRAEQCRTKPDANSAR
jgi:hypothetical protein